MKKAITAVLVVLMAGSAVSHSDGLPNAGSTPGSVFFALDRAQESVSLMFTADKDKPAKKLQFAEERLSEAKKLSSKNRSKRASKALKLYSNRMSQLQDEAPEIVNESSGHHAEVLEGLKQSLPESAQSGINRALEASRNGRTSSSESESPEQPTRGFMATGHVVQSN